LEWLLFDLVVITTLRVGGWVFISQFIFSLLSNKKKNLSLIRNASFGIEEKPFRRTSYRTYYRDSFRGVPSLLPFSFSLSEPYLRLLHRRDNSGSESLAQIIAPTQAQPRPSSAGSANLNPNPSSRSASPRPGSHRASVNSGNDQLPRGFVSLIRLDKEKREKKKKNEKI